MVQLHLILLMGFGLKLLKMNKVFWGVLVIVVLVAVLYLCRNYLPPRSAYKVARIHSDLKINRGFNVIDFTEEYSFNGEGLVNIVFELNEAEVESLIRVCKKRDYKKVSIQNLIKDGFLDENPDYGMQLYNRDIRKISNGYYKLEARSLSNLDFSITVLDVSNKELIIYVNIP